MKGGDYYSVLLDSIESGIVKISHHDEGISNNIMFNMKDYSQSHMDSLDVNLETFKNIVNISENYILLRTPASENDMKLALFPGGKAEMGFLLIKKSLLVSFQNKVIVLTCNEKIGSVSRRFAVVETHDEIEKMLKLPNKFI